ncbi:MAG: bifunctional nuclease family protein [Ilumatobacteraceae bacterium]
MDLIGVRLEVPAQTPVMMLREQQEPGRLLPIYIGSPEAAAIHYAMEGIEPMRPLTHDLLSQTIDVLGATLERVVVTEIRDHTFYAELHLSREDEEGETVVSCRPSDAVALAVRAGCEIFVEDVVLDTAGKADERATPEDAEEGAEEILAEFQDFIAHVSPEDFAE